MEADLSGKVAMISGGSKGVGKAIAYALAKEGVTLSICARNQADLEKTAAELGRETEAEIIYTVADLQYENDIQKFVDKTIDTYGKVDILINNAGAAPMGDFLQLEDEVFESTWRLKFLGYLRLSKAVFPHMKKEKEGNIIHVIGGWGKHPLKNYMVGGHVNAALLNLTKTMSYDGAEHNIRVNGINPGPLNTGRWGQLMQTMAELEGKEAKELEKRLLEEIALGRIGEPDEVANLAVFLASGLSSYITGAIIPIDGGMRSSI